MTEWLYAQIDEIREDLKQLGAKDSLRVVDEVCDQLKRVPGAEESPELVILTPNFESWQRAATPTAEQMADEIEECVLSFACANVDQLQAAPNKPYLDSSS